MRRFVFVLTYPEVWQPTLDEIAEVMRETAVRLDSGEVAGTIYDRKRRPIGEFCLQP